MSDEEEDELEGCQGDGECDDCSLCDEIRYEEQERDRIADIKHKVGQAEKGTYWVPWTEDEGNLLVLLDHCPPWESGNVVVPALVLQGDYFDIPGSVVELNEEDFELLELFQF